MDLRKPRNHKGIWYGVINLGKPKNPVWQTIKENSKKKDVEIIRNPHTNHSKEWNSLMHNNSSYMNTLETSNISLKNLDNMSTINVNSLILLKG